MDALRFDDRTHAGRLLAARLADLAGEDLVVLVLPRGGVPVGLEIARRLGADLDVLVVQKIPVPGNDELALGAVGADGKVVVNQQIAKAVGIEPRHMQAMAGAWASVLAARAAGLRQGRPPQPIGGRVAIVVDDGGATGASMRAALDIARSAGPDKLIAAIPVAPGDVCHELTQTADRAECLLQPDPFVAVGRWYRDFSQLTDGEVRRLLDAVPVRSMASRGWM